MHNIPRHLLYTPDISTYGSRPLNQIFIHDRSTQKWYRLQRLFENQLLRQDQELIESGTRFLVNPSYFDKIVPVAIKCLPKITALFLLVLGAYRILFWQDDNRPSLAFNSFTLIAGIAVFAYGRCIDRVQLQERKNSYKNLTEYVTQRFKSYRDQKGRVDLLFQEGSLSQVPSQESSCHIVEIDSSDEKDL